MRIGPDKNNAAVYFKRHDGRVINANPRDLRRFVRGVNALAVTDFNVAPSLVNIALREAQTARGFARAELLIEGDEFALRASGRRH